MHAVSILDKVESIKSKLHPELVLTSRDIDIVKKERFDWIEVIFSSKLNFE